MKRILVIIAGSAVAFATPAVAATAFDVPVASAPVQAQTAPTLPGVTPPGEDKQVEGKQVEGEEVESGPLGAEDFVFLAGVTILFEIETSRLAVERSKATDVRELAQRILADREAALRNLRAAASAHAPPLVLDEDHRRIVKAVAAEDPADFDETWLGLMIDTHEEAIALYEEFKDTEGERKLREFAASALPRLNEFLTQVHEAHESAVAGQPGGSR